MQSAGEVCNLPAVAAAQVWARSDSNCHYGSESESAHSKGLEETRQNKIVLSSSTLNNENVLEPFDRRPQRPDYFGLPACLTTLARQLKFLTPYGQSYHRFVCTLKFSENAK